ncbi:hypothetical protein BED47_18935 [Gottfriedia luciferensis]|uniref:DUF4047 domain-containing protein n=1 Tax=Gottfriedia luciferensis TaxID=178774 RepID=A0ABX2ZVQ8_9BACI|nr:DUF4047 domain-containing protein [Gottfriedia luciferensis]ODG92519.1 hypothetical protein BED47_18935 [Gottfriedia luciferensis]
MRSTSQKSILFSSLICISFYTGIQFVGETDASFSSQASSAPVNLSTAIVFPSNVKKLEDEAQNIADTINKEYKTIFLSPSNVTLLELRERLGKIKEIEREINVQLGDLESIKKELSTTKLKIKNQKGVDKQTFAFVGEGDQKVSSILKEVHSMIDFQQIEAVRSSISNQINNIEEKAKLNYVENHSKTNSDDNND